MGNETHKRKMKGVVVATAMDITAVVAVTRFMEHPKYRKYVKKTERFKAHDEGNASKKGDEVVIEECRPIAKDKHFRIVT